MTSRKDAILNNVQLAMMFTEENESKLESKVTLMSPHQFPYLVPGQLQN